MKNFALLISGGGTTAEAVIKACQKNELTGVNPIVISSNKEARGNERAVKLGIRPHIINRQQFVSREEFDEKLLQLLKQLKIDVIALLGWLHLVPATIIHQFENRIINQHPGALDPGREGFGGEGMSTPYRVNSALLAYIWTSGEKLWAESDTHFITEKFDMGDLIRTEIMPVSFKKRLLTIKELRQNPKELIETTHVIVKAFYPVEYRNVIITLQLFSDGGVKGFKRNKPLIPPDRIPLLTEAKKLAIELFPAYNL